MAAAAPASRIDQIRSYLTTVNAKGASAYDHDSALYLLVEDEEPVAKGVRYALESEGRHVDWAPEAITVLQRLAVRGSGYTFLEG